MTKTALAGRIKGFSRTRHRRTWVALTVLAASFLHLPAQAYDFQVCNGCHKVIMDEVFRPYIHVPFMQQRCAECHAARESTAQPAKSPSARRIDRRKIQWLGESYMADTSHGFVLSAEKAVNALVVEVLGSGGTYSRQEIAVPPLAQLAELKDSGKPPVISDARVLGVERGVFLSATIGWQTDTLTNALVRYGNMDLSQSSQPGNRLGLRHEVVLNNLKPDQTYRFSVASTDLFGRSQTSEPLTFSTSISSIPIAAPLPPQPGISPERGGEAGLTSHFKRVGTRYLLELTLEQPASVFVGTGEMTQKQAQSNGSDGPTGGDDKHHAGLSSKKVVALEACRSCHQNQATATHPVNVYPKPGMIIPPEYPTLPDGRITCRSCHESHSSEYEYLTIKGDKRELCVGCHKDMI